MLAEQHYSRFNKAIQPNGKIYNQIYELLMKMLQNDIGLVENQVSFFIDNEYKDYKSNRVEIRDFRIERSYTGNLPNSNPLWVTRSVDKNKANTELIEARGSIYVDGECLCSERTLASFPALNEYGLLTLQGTPYSPVNILEREPNIFTNNKGDKLTFTPKKGNNLSINLKDYTFQYKGNYFNLLKLYTELWLIENNINQEEIDNIEVNDFKIQSSNPIIQEWIDGILILYLQLNEIKESSDDKLISRIIKNKISELTTIHYLKDNYYDMLVKLFNNKDVVRMKKNSKYLYDLDFLEKYKYEDRYRLEGMLKTQVYSLFIPILEILPHEHYLLEYYDGLYQIDENLYSVTSKTNLDYPYLFFIFTHTNSHFIKGKEKLVFAFPTFKPNLQYKEDNVINSNDVLLLILLSSIQDDERLEKMQNVDIYHKKYVMFYEDIVIRYFQQMEQRTRKLLIERQKDKRVEGVEDLRKVYDSEIKTKKAFYTLWRSYVYSGLEQYLRESGYIQYIDLKNPLYYYSQINKVDSDISSNLISSELRQPSLHSFNKLCIYETPESKRVGVTTNFTNNVIIDDEGYFRIKLYKVNKFNDKVVIDRNNYVILDELDISVGTKIGCIDKLMQAGAEGRGSEAEGDFSLFPVQVSPVSPTAPERIEINGDEVVSAYHYTPFKNLVYVKISELDYVYEPDSYLSDVASTIPFLGSSQAIRNSYAIGQVKQSKVVLNSETPYVYKPSLRVQESTPFHILAPCDGMFDYMDKDDYYFIFDKQTGKEIFRGRVYKLIMTYNIALRMKRVVNFQQEVKKGDVLFTSDVIKNNVYSTGVNALVLYTPTGYNNNDSIEISRAFSKKLVSTQTSYQTVNCKHSDLELNPVQRYYSAFDNQLIAKQLLPKNKLKTINNTSLEGYVVDIEDKVDESKIWAIKVNHCTVGDKLVNRYGNKGTVSGHNDELLTSFYTLDNGAQVDIVYNSLSVPSRGNYGQLYESLLGFCFYLLGYSYCIYNESEEIVRQYLKLVHTLANTLDKDKFISIVNSTPLIEQQYKELVISRFEFITNWANIFDEEGNAYYTDTQTGIRSNTKAMIGCTYIYKLEHESNKKVNSRSFVDDSNFLSEEGSVTKNPHTGKGKGEACGAMESWAYLAYGAKDVAHYIYSTKGNNYLELLNDIYDMYKEELPEQYRDMINTGNLDYASSTTTEKMIAYLRGLGIDIQFEGNNENKLNFNKEQLIHREYTPADILPFIVFNKEGNDKVNTLDFSKSILSQRERALLSSQDYTQIMLEDVDLSV